MTVIIMETAPEKLRGELTRWLIEAKPGVFIGNLSALVRDKLWKKVCTSVPSVSALLIYTTTGNEQGYQIKMNGDPRRQIVEMEGLQLIKVADTV